MELVDQFIAAVLSVLPLSPFQEFFDMVQAIPFLPVLNWLVPIGMMGRIFRGWLVCVGLYFLYNLILRKIGLIQ